MHIAVCTDVIVDNGVGLDAAVAQCLSPKSRLVGEIGTSVLGQPPLERCWIVRAESDPYDPAPSGTELVDPHANALPNHNWPVAEQDALAVALPPGGQCTLLGQRNVLPMAGVEVQRGQVVVGRRGMVRGSVVTVVLSHDGGPYGVDELFHLF
jgi:hypothetical protein